MKYEIHPDLDKTLSKLAKRDRTQFEAILKKIEEITTAPNIDHYKNLRSPLNKYKRVHVNTHFVLLFTKVEQIILFRYYDHHDNVYQFRE